MSAPPIVDVTAEVGSPPIVEVSTDLASIGSGGNIESVDAPLTFDDETGHLGHDPHAIGDVTGLQAALDAKALAGDLTTEQGVRSAADAALDARLDAIEGLGSLATDAELAAEAATRSAADSALDSRLDAIEGLGSLATDAELAAESATRAANDTTLQEGIDDEAAARAAADALLIPLTQKGAANGVATLGADSKIPTSQIPSLAIQEAFPVANQAAMLALDAQRGDIALRSDNNKVYILTSDDPTELTDWIEWLYPGGGVASFNGRVGVVVPASGDYSLAEITGLQDALDDKADQTALDAVESASIAADAALDTRVDALEALVPEATDALDTRVDALEALVPEATDALDTRVDAVEADNATQDSRLDNLESTLGGSTDTRLIQGATIAWVSGLTYRVGAATYMIEGTVYTSDEDTVTLADGDATHPRIDVITLDAAGVLDKITGTPSASPAKPQVDPALYLDVTFIQVEATATVAPVTNETVYTENGGTGGGEWAATTSGGSVVANSTASPRSGTTHVRGTAVASGGYVQFTESAPVDVDDFNAVVFYIKPTAAWPTQKKMRVSLMLSGVEVGTAVLIASGQYGFNRNGTAAYQQIVIPMSVFAMPVGATFDRLRVEVNGGGSSVGFDLDDVMLQGGLTASPQGATLPPGGATGTALIKQSSTDFDAIWRAIQQADIVGLVAALAAKADVAALASLKEFVMVVDIDGGGSALSSSNPAKPAIYRFPQTGTFTLKRWAIYGDASGSLVVDIKRATYAGLPTFSSIAGTNKPTLSSAQKAEDSTLTGWGDLTCDGGDFIQPVVDSGATIVKAQVFLTWERS